MKGRIIIPALRDVACDPQNSEFIRLGAWRLLGDMNAFDEPGMLSTLLEEHRAGRITRSSLYWTVRHVVPIDDWLDTDPIAQSGIVDWLSAQLAKKTYAQIQLEILDGMMKPERYQMTRADPFLRRMLNRLNDRDLDEWLKESHPIAYQYRQRELAKGYDPADTLATDLGSLIEWDGDLEAAVKDIYREESDRQGCKELVTAIYKVRYDLSVRKDDWEDRLREWYRANRGHFVYDPKLHRFIVSINAHN